MFLRFFDTWKVWMLLGLMWEKEWQKAQVSQWSILQAGQKMTKTCTVHERKRKKKKLLMSKYLKYLIVNCHKYQALTRNLSILSCFWGSGVKWTPCSSSRLACQNRNVSERRWGKMTEKSEKAPRVLISAIYRLWQDKVVPRVKGISGYGWASFTSFPAAPHVKAGQWSDRSWRHHVMSPRPGPRGFGQIWYQFRSRPKEAWVGSQQSPKPIRAPTPARAPLVGLFWLI